MNDNKFLEYQNNCSSNVKVNNNPLIAKKNVSNNKPTELPDEENKIKTAGERTSQNEKPRFY